MERIVAVAISQDGLIISLPAPARHFNVMMLMIDILKLPQPINGEQGFLTSTGRFVNRHEAKTIATAAGQETLNFHPTQLFSEDLW